MTEVTNTDEMYKTLKESNNKINELKSDYLDGKDKEIDDFLENDSVIYNNQSNFLMVIYLKIYKELQQNKYLNQDHHHHHYQYNFRIIAERVKSNPQEIKILIPNNLITRLPILLPQIKSGKNSCKLKNEIRQVMYLLYKHNKI